MQNQYKELCIVGSGVVGTATGTGFEAKGFSVTYVDVQRSRVGVLRKLGKEAYTPEALREVGKRHGVYFLTVSTPTEEGRINLRYLESASRDLGLLLAATSASTEGEYPVVVVRSTVPPGTTENLVAKAIENSSGKRVGADFGLCMNPEFLREDSSEADFAKPWVVVIGQYNEKSGNVVQSIYGDFGCPIFRTTVQEAEMEKYVHNLFNATKISFFNEMRGVCQKLGLDAESIFPLVAKSCEGLWNAAYGTRNLGPFAGSCLPKDTKAFLSWAEENGIRLDLLRAVIDVNEKMTNDK